MSRPPRAESPGKAYSVRLSDKERSIIHEAASVTHQPFPDFVREALLSTAEEVLEESHQESVDESRRDESCTGLGEVPRKTDT
jgi:uncharacterized protein (DUF1778 family)